MFIVPGIPNKNGKIRTCLKMRPLKYPWPLNQVLLQVRGKHFLLRTRKCAGSINPGILQRKQCSERVTVEVWVFDVDHCTAELQIPINVDGFLEGWSGKDGGTSRALPGVAVETQEEPREPWRC